MEKRIELEKRRRDPSQIHELVLDNCRSTNIEGLTEEFVNLKSLSLIGVGLTSLKGFPKLAKLKELDVSKNKLSGSLKYLKPCLNIFILNLSNNLIREIRKLDPLTHLSNLKILQLSRNEIVKLESYKEHVFNLIIGLTYLDGIDRNGELPDPFETEELEEYTVTKTLLEVKKEKLVTSKSYNEQKVDAATSAAIILTEDGPDELLVDKDVNPHLPKKDLEVRFLIESEREDSHGKEKLIGDTEKKERSLEDQLKEKDEDNERKDRRIEELEEKLVTQGIKIKSRNRKTIQPTIQYILSLDDYKNIDFGLKKYEKDCKKQNFPCPSFMINPEDPLRLAWVKIRMDTDEANIKLRSTRAKSKNKKRFSILSWITKDEPDKDVIPTDDLET